jgi:murein DD-endopeptidase MepM/ murein hydrolase activator NlpD
MNPYRLFLNRLGMGLVGGCLYIAPFGLNAIAQPQPPQPQPSPLAANTCPQRPALERFQSYRVKAGDTLASIAQRSGLLGTTLMGANPSIRNGKVMPGQTLKIPPYNGITVSVPAGRTLKSVAAIYKVRPDLLFEVNGCQTAPRIVFVPGINWSPTSATAAVTPLPTQPIGKVAANLRQDHYPLAKPADIRRSYGWQGREKIVFSSGVDLAATPGTYALSVAAGTVAFAGKQKPWGGMVVLNHTQGRQTRYGYLGAIKVKVGQTVQRGQILGAIAPTPAALRFELRYRSALGWVAQDPLPYLQAISPVRSSRQP